MELLHFTIHYVSNNCRLSSNNSSPKHVEYFYEMVTSFDVPGLSCRSVEDGYIVLADIQLCGMYNN